MKLIGAIVGGVVRVGVTLYLCALISGGAVLFAAAWAYRNVTGRWPKWIGFMAADGVDLQDYGKK